METAPLMPLALARLVSVALAAMDAPRATTTILFASFATPPPLATETETVQQLEAVIARPTSQAVIARPVPPVDSPLSAFLVLVAKTPLAMATEPAMMVTTMMEPANVTPLFVDPAVIGPH
jgi:hypothetical protein